MSKEIVINVNPFETRVAFLENGSLTEIFIERVGAKSVTSNIYRGKVRKVLPGMQVAFVDIGLERAGFLHLKDLAREKVQKLPDFVNALQSQDEDIENELNSLDDTAVFPSDGTNIEDILTEGQELMVQVIKNPIGSKGSRISAYIALPGRYLVLMPMASQTGVSRRIDSREERDRLRKIVEECGHSGRGYIIRTAAENAGREDIKRDIDFLEKIWSRIQEKNEKASAPFLLHRDLDIVLRSIRDLYQPDVQRIIIDSEADYQRSINFMNTYMGDFRPEIELYNSPEPIFDLFGIEIEIERALDTKVWLKSGGYIVIDRTEALTAIDVNTGKYVGGVSQEDTVLQTNLEAVKEIVYQLPLRNVGGLIIIDFIDMEKEESKEKVFNSLENALRHDRSRTKILRVSELGLVEMTRKRTRTNLSRILCRPCPNCEGRGFMKSPRTICYEIFREIRRRLAKLPDIKKIVLVASPEISTAAVEEETGFLEQLETDYNCKVAVRSDPAFPDEHFEISVPDYV